MIAKIYGESGVLGFFKGVAFRCGLYSFGGIVYFGALSKARHFMEVL